MRGFTQVQGEDRGARSAPETSSQILKGEVPRIEHVASTEIPVLRERLDIEVCFTRPAG